VRGGVSASLRHRPMIASSNCMVPATSNTIVLGLSAVSIPYRSDPGPLS